MAYNDRGQRESEVCAACPWKIGGYVSAVDGVEGAVLNTACIRRVGCSLILNSVSHPYSLSLLPVHSANTLAFFIKPRRAWTSSTLLDILRSSDEGIWVFSCSCRAWKLPGNPDE